MSAKFPGPDIFHHDVEASREASPAHPSLTRLTKTFSISSPDPEFRYSPVAQYLYGTSYPYLKSGVLPGAVAWQLVSSLHGEAAKHVTYLEMRIDTFTTLFLSHIAKTLRVLRTLKLEAQQTEPMFWAQGSRVGWTHPGMTFEYLKNADAAAPWQPAFANAARYPIQMQALAYPPAWLAPDEATPTFLLPRMPAKDTIAFSTYAIVNGLVEILKPLKQLEALDLNIDLDALVGDRPLGAEYLNRNAAARGESVKRATDAIEMIRNSIASLMFVQLGRRPLEKAEVKPPQREELKPDYQKELGWSDSHWPRVQREIKKKM